MTEDQIEREVEKRVDRLDRNFMNSFMTQADYDAAMRAIDRWAEYQYLFATKSN